jgi:hypothetical protein
MTYENFREEHLKNGDYTEKTILEPLAKLREIIEKDGMKFKKSATIIKAHQTIKTNEWADWFYSQELEYEMHHKGWIPQDTLNKVDNQWKALFLANYKSYENNRYAIKIKKELENPTQSKPQEQNIELNDLQKVAKTIYADLSPDISAKQLI